MFDMKQLMVALIASAVAGAFAAEDPQTKKAPDGDFGDCYTVTRGEDWVPVDYRKSIVPGSVIDFSGMGFADAPAGKHGWLKVVDGHFAFEDSPDVRRRFSGPNLCFEGCCPPEDLADEFADRLVRLGYNTIRVHHYEKTLSMGDKGWDGHYDWHAFAPEKIARFDRFMAACFKRGIYVTTDLFVSRVVLWKDVGERLGNKGESWIHPRHLYKALVMLDEVAYQDWCAWARLFLTHRNPHTGRTYAEEPGLPLVALVNENCLYPVWDTLRKHPLFVAEWKRWLQAERAKDETFLKGITDDLTSDKAPKAKSAAFYFFKAHLEERFFTRASTFLRKELGVKALLTSQNNGGTAPALQRVREKLYDYCDGHHYDEHPSYDAAQHLPGAPKAYLSRQRDLDPIENAWAGGALSAFLRIAGKPIVFTESDHVYPARYRVAYGLKMGATAGLQEYDGVWRFGWTMNGNEMCRELRDNVKVTPRYFDMLSDPLGLATERLVSLLFLRGDIPPLAEPGLAVRLDRRLLGPNPGKDFKPEFNIRGVLDRKVAVCVDSPAPAGWTEIGSDAMLVTQAKGGVGLPVPADPNCALVHDKERRNMRVATKRTCAAFAFKESGRVEAGALAFSLDRTFALVSASSVDAEPTPLASAKRILVMHLTNLQAEGSVFSDDSFRYFLKKGTDAVVADGAAEIELALERPEDCTVWSLDTAGNRTGKVASSVKGGRLAFAARVRGPDGKARFLYEVTRERASANASLPPEFAWAGRFKKYAGNPIIRPQGEWASDLIFNPTAVVKDGRVGLLCRAVNLKERPKDRCWSVSSLIWAWSDDGYHFTLDEKPFLHPTAAWPKAGPCPYLGGFEDPRIVYVPEAKTYVLCYTGVRLVTGADGKEVWHTPALIAWSKDLKTWEWGPETFPNRAVCITPQKVNGRYWAYYDNSTLKTSWSEDLRTWHHTGRSAVVGRKGKFDSELCEAVAAPVMGEIGILLLYNGAMGGQQRTDYMKRWTGIYSSGGFAVYQTGWALFDPHDPERLLAQSDEPIVSPTEPFERFGFVNGTIFASGLVKFRGKWMLYYGCADNRIGVATADCAETPL